MSKRLKRTMIVAASAAAAAAATLATGTPASADAYFNAGTFNCGFVGTCATSATTHLDLQSDGNVVLYCSNSGRAIWATGTYGRDSRITTINFQSDGNLVEYDITDPTYHQPLWSSGTWGHPNAVFKVQDDNNMVIYDPQNVGTNQEWWKPIWASNTYHACG